MSLPLLPSRIAALPRTASGLPVPYVAAYDGEMPFVVRKSLTYNGPFLCEQHDLRGAPQLGRMNLTRQREVIRAGLCQVCREPLPASHRWLVSLAEAALDVQGPLVREPWACPTCLAFALRVCPGLLGVHRRGELEVWRVTRWRIVLARTDLAGLHREGSLAPCGPRSGWAFGYAKIEALQGTTLSVAAFLAAFESTGAPADPALT